tara:strand:- start:722 stop:1144 length:423 start_codon:yes stop_codon:yes gene_type:complete
MVKFNYEKEIWKKFINPKKFALLLKIIEENEICKIIEINYQLISDKKILEINNKYLNHNYFTDVIAFDRNRGSRKMADIYVSVERVQDNSQNLGVLFQTELNRVMVHGLLHVLGYNDTEKKDKILMSKKEDYYINQYKNI